MRSTAYITLTVAAILANIAASVFMTNPVARSIAVGSLSFSITLTTVRGYAYLVEENTQKH